MLVPDQSPSIQLLTHSQTIHIRSTGGEIYYFILWSTLWSYSHNNTTNVNPEADNTYCCWRLLSIRLCVRTGISSSITRIAVAEQKHTEQMFKQLVCKGSLFQYFFVTCGEFRSPYLGKASAAARTVQPIPTTVCSLFIPTIIWLPMFGIFNEHTNVAESIQLMNIQFSLTFNQLNQISASTNKEIKNTSSKHGQWKQVTHKQLLLSNLPCQQASKLLSMVKNKSFVKIVPNDKSQNTRKCSWKRLAFNFSVQLQVMKVVLLVFVTI